MSTEVLRTFGLSIGYHQPRKVAFFGQQNPSILNSKRLFSGLSLQLQAGELVCLLGPNGSGKTTLMRTLTGIQQPIEGTVEILGHPVTKIPPKEIARYLSVVLTERISVSNLSVYALVALGRYPYTGWSGKLSAEDEAVVREAIELTGILPFVNRHISDLSDGERQKVMIARALAQDTPVIFLDEPTAHLDLPNRVAIMQLLKRLAKEKNKCVLLSTHELDLALQAADKIWLMSPHQNNNHNSQLDSSKLDSSRIEASLSHEHSCVNPDRAFITGIPEELVLNGQFETAFRSNGFDFDKHTGSFRIHKQTNGEIGLIGHGAPAHWTKRALERLGYKVLPDKSLDRRIELDTHNNKSRWLYYPDRDRAARELYSISEIIREIEYDRKE